MADEHGADGPAGAVGRVRPADAFRNRCLNAARVLASCGDYSLQRVSLDESQEDPKENSLDVWLREGPSKPDVVISLSHPYAVEPWEHGLTPVFIDRISLTHLPALPAPWPEEAVGRLDRTEDLPELAWLRIDGPVTIDALGQIVTLYRAQSDDEASVLD
ncbi:MULTISPECIES: hypothetical protein [Kitasatospora]|uniref:Uncharacterized protein n=1 Tax=Kitasatospora setae (strain ATCC 33774 / DSM 43861 / JCM 3304 / KCC A-0304 / NBRC 14216 / KM-6054) TaxID=452652 RepID=E4N3A9_KITSK|nr:MULTISPECIES: hypothetical protein [Kitasatospora]BAJ32643.1 hypothetical protein KSE_68850 [Kitasatospora setae KM-6054]